MPHTSNYPAQLVDFLVEPLKSEDQLVNPTCKAGFSLWSSLASPRHLKSDHLLQAPEIVPYITVLDWSNEFRDFVFRFVGQRIVDISKRDLTGRRLFKDCRQAIVSRGFCEAYLEHQGPLLSKNSYTVTENFTEVSFVEAILFDGYTGEGDVRIAIVHGLQA